MKLFCVGLNHQTANVETREHYATAPVFDSSWREASGCAEALLLTTCNRVEVYAAAPTHVPTEMILRMLSRNSADALEQDLFYRHEAERCVEHLFRVASGFDSMVVGETEILGQTKRAYEKARDFGGVGPYLHRLFQRAFRVAKQVRSRTEITRGAVSVGSVAVDLAQKIFGKLNGRKVLVLGAGETSERTARALVSRGVTDLRVSNRSDERAAELVARAGGRVVKYDAWLEEFREIDILISSTAAPEPLLTREKLAPMLSERPDRPLFIIDIAVPRDVAPEVNEMEGVYLYDMDSLQAIAAQSLALRREQMSAGEKIIADHVIGFCEALFGEKQDVSLCPPEGVRPLPTQGL
jgi:glutamyl-tRNA reductase